MTSKQQPVYALEKLDGSGRYAILARGLCYSGSFLEMGQPSEPHHAPILDAIFDTIAAAPETAAERDRLRAVNAQLLAALQMMVTTTACTGAPTPEAMADSRRAMLKAMGEDQYMRLFGYDRESAADRAKLAAIAKAEQEG